MRKIVLGLGGLLLATAAVLLVRDAGQSAGELWASIDPNTLVGLGSLIENRIDPDLWVDVVLPMLTWPAWIYPGVAGVILGLAAQPRRRKQVSDAAQNSGDSTPT